MKRLKTCNKKANKGRGEKALAPPSFFSRRDMETMMRDENGDFVITREEREKSGLHRFHLSKREREGARWDFRRRRKKKGFSVHCRFLSMHQWRSHSNGNQEKPSSFLFFS